MSFILKIILKFPLKTQINIAKKYLEYQFKNKIEIKVNNRENLDNINAPIIFVANHLSNIDGIVLSRVLKDFDPFFVAGQKLSENDFTNIFINIVKNIQIKPNSADIESMKNIVGKLKDGNNIMIFPEGTRSRTSTMIEAKKGILLMAKLSKATLVPIGIMGTERVMPINKDGKMDEEKMIPGRIDIKIGQPFKLFEKTKEMDKNEYERKALDDIMHRIAVLVDEKYRGVYSFNE